MKFLRIMVSFAGVCLLALPVEASAQIAPGSGGKASGAMGARGPRSAKPLTLKGKRGPGIGSFAPTASWDDAPKTYTVRRGDTLWDISNRYLGSPWYWPKVWARNPHILNPHWIYPGSKLKFTQAGEIRPKSKKRAVEREWRDVSMASVKGGLQLESAGIRISGRGILRWAYTSSKDIVIIRRESYVGVRSLKRAGKITGSPIPNSMLTVRDRVFIKFKQLRNVRTGEKYTIYRVTKKVKHPMTGKLSGYMVRIYGTIQVERILKESAVARITDAFRSIERGYLIGKYMSARLRVRRRPAEALVRGYVLRPHHNVELFAEQYICFVDRGRRHGLRTGNTMSIYRRGDARLAGLPPKDRKGMSKRKIGELLIIDTRLDHAVALITRSRLEVSPGDEVETTLSR